MIAGRPVRIVLAAAAIGTAGVLTLVGFVRPALASLDGCDSCTLGTPTAVLVGIPSAFIILAAGLLVWPALARPMAVGSALAAVVLVGPVAQASSPTVAAVILCLVSSACFLLATPIGPGTGPLALSAWIVAITGALGLWVLDSTFSGFMVTEPVASQPTFLIVAAVVLGAGLLSGALRRFEGPVAEVS
jgi:hypothetical protein